MAERFSQKNLRVRPSSDEEKIVTNAKKHFEKTLVEISGELVGSVAALEHPTKTKKLKYGEIFLRDNVPVMKSIKRSLDVNNIMNPGKIFDLN